MQYCDNYNDRALTFQILNNDRAVPRSLKGRRYDSRCIDPFGQKSVQTSQEFYLINDSFDNYSRYHSSRMNVLPTLYNTGTLIGQKHVQFISALDY